MRELALGVVLGLAAGVAPGPLLALVVGAALERGFLAGARVAAAPLVSDAPVVALSVLVLDELPDAAVAACSIGGGLFVAWLGVEQLRHAGAPPAADVRGGGRDLARAALVNVLNPHPWLFWLGAGGPLLLRAGERSAWAAAAFLVGFYGLLVGTKVALAGGVAAGRRRLLAGRGYALAVRVASLALVVAGALLVVEGAQRL